MDASCEIDDLDIQIFEEILRNENINNNSSLNKIKKNCNINVNDNNSSTKEKCSINVNVNDNDENCVTNKYGLPIIFDFYKLFSIRRTTRNYSNF